MVHKLQKRLKKILKSEEHVRATSLLGLLLLITAIPLTVYVLDQRQDIRQHANAFQLRSIDTNACGEVISQPAAGAGSGDIVYKAPVKAADGTWQTVKQDGTVKTEAEIRQKFLDDPRNGGTLEERQQNLATAIGTDYINCNVFINSANNTDCDVTFQTQLPNGSDAGKLPSGGTTTLHLVAGSGTGTGCRKLVKTAVANSPTAAPTPTPTSSLPPPPTAFPTDDPADTPPPQPTPTPTHAPTGTPAVTAQPTQSNKPTQVSLVLLLPGIGAGGTKDPNNATREIVFQLFSSTNQKIGADVGGKVSFDSAAGIFKGTLNLGTIVPTGSYMAKVKLAQSLSKAIVAQLTAGTTTTLPQVTLVTGDVNNDNTLDIKDFNIIASCYLSKSDSEACGGKKVDADINDDGVVDGVDYNLFITGLKKAQKGE